MTLFTPETKDTLEHCKQKCKFLQDPHPIDKMYIAIKPKKNSTHGLTEYISIRGESKLEGFHDSLAHFANAGMNNGLADAINLCGTARYNLAIRHKLRLINKEKENDIPLLWEKVVPFHNHCELNHVNKLAKESTMTSVPFPNVETLVDDTGERFFSEYLIQQREREKNYKRHNLNDRCQCVKCAGNSDRLTHDSSIHLNHEIEQSNDEQPLQGNLVAESKATADSQLETVTTRESHGKTACQRAVIQKQQIQQKKYVPTVRGYPTFPLPPMMPVVQQPLIYPRMGPGIYQDNWFLHEQPHLHSRPRTQCQYCCVTFLNWASNPGRRGRPPHELSCSKRRKLNNGEYL